MYESLYADHRDGGLLLHPSGEYYSLGASVPEEQLFVVSVTLSNPSNLPEVHIYMYIHYVNLRLVSLSIMLYSRCLVATIIVIRFSKLN